MIERWVAAIAGRQHGVVSRRQLRALGLSDAAIGRRVRGGRLFRVFPGVYSLVPEPTALGRAFAALLAAGADRHLVGPGAGRPTDRGIERLDPNVRLSHWTVLELHELTRKRSPVVHVTTIGGGPRCRASGVRGHRLAALAPADRSLVAGLPAVSVARSLLEVAPAIEHRELRSLLREAQYQRLVLPADLERVEQDVPRHRGWSHLARADPDLMLTTRAESPLAGDLARFIEHGLGFGPWVQEHGITSPSGNRYRFDHACPPLMLAAEADGGGHRGSVTQSDDADRDAETSAMGWLTVRVTRHQLRDPERLRRQLHAIRAQRGQLLRRPDVAA